MEEIRVVDDAYDERKPMPTPVIIGHRTKSIPDISHLGASDTAARIELALARIYTMTGFSPEVSDRADFEDSIEEILRTDAALTACDPESTWFHLIDPTDEASPIVLGEQGAVPEDTPYFGPPPSSVVNKHRQHHSCKPDALDYWTIEAVTSRMGRSIELAGFTPDDGSLDVTEALKRIGAKRTRPAIVKSTTAKKRPVTEAWVDMFGSFCPKDISWEWAPVTEEGISATVMVQQKIPMDYEYRFFLIDGKPVASAAAIEEYTPLQNTSKTPWHPKMRKDRTAKTIPVTRHDTLQHYLQFVTKAGTDLIEERPDLNAVVCDVAMSEGSPVIVELNPMGNAGLYATDPHSIAEAYFASAGHTEDH